MGKEMTERKRNGKRDICILGILVMILMTNTAMAAVTTFTMSTITPSLEFKGNKVSKWVNATGVPAGTAWGNVTNTGDVKQTFKVSVDVLITGVQLIYNNIDSSTGRVIVGTTPIAWRGSANVLPNGTVNMFVRANFTNVADNTYNQNLAISNV